LSVRRGRTGRARSVEKTLKETAPCRQLRRLEPIQVIVDLGHSIGKSGAQSFELGQSHPNCVTFSECELRNKVLIILNDRPKDRVGVGSEQHELLSEFLERHSLHRSRLFFGKDLRATKIYRDHRQAKILSVTADRVFRLFAKKSKGQSAPSASCSRSPISRFSPNRFRQVVEKHPANLRADHLKQTRDCRCNSRGTRDRQRFRRPT